MSESIAARAEEICAHLLIFPHLKRDQYRDLLLDEELRDEVQRRLRAVGMELAESFYSDFYAVRPRPEVEADVRFDWAANQRLSRGAVALLVVLWAKLVLPRRLAREKRFDPDDPNMELFPEERQVKDIVYKVPKEAVLAEFASRFGRHNLLRYIGRLKRLGFVREDRSGRLSEGPLLDLLVDGGRLAMEIQNGVLWDMLGTGRQEIGEGGDGDLDPDLALGIDDEPDDDDDLDDDEDEDEQDA